MIRTAPTPQLCTSYHLFTSLTTQPRGQHTQHVAGRCDHRQRSGIFGDPLHRLEILQEADKDSGRQASRLHHRERGKRSSPRPPNARPTAAFSQSSEVKVTNNLK